eukprot:CAMPEP_0177183238 /NCGR_PEP_ID=MMETSP0367-20130122/16906_1 /TAXON_ID=447022 ORGANISM="Scrippsiella hangoei-like, Strain SHHI-4" /NCGR_SAMPLE_ID=MMETSP0367 /ASSEMBLY_ACC=CAM_ASM_000362 /LENGTH=190 /DNA_ID=CAMNT_0018630251 /DNA_START=314 /DNA_END=885 /DNA_ORIENTATION=-
MSHTAEAADAATNSTAASHAEELRTCTPEVSVSGSPEPGLVVTASTAAVVDVGSAGGGTSKWRELVVGMVVAAVVVVVVVVGGGGPKQSWTFSLASQSNKPGSADGQGKVLLCTAPSARGQHWLPMQVALLPGQATVWLTGQKPGNTVPFGPTQSADAHDTDRPNTTIGRRCSGAISCDVQRAPQEGIVV